MKYWEMDALFRISLTSALLGGELLGSRPGHSTLQDKNVTYPLHR
jgi:hypothetical protein